MCNCYLSSLYIFPSLLNLLLHFPYRSIFLKMAHKSVKLFDKYDKVTNKLSIIYN